jgi:hypothetical protein
MALVDIEGHQGLVRDTRSKALLNNDRKALDEYQMKVEIAKRQIAEKEETKMRLTKLEENMSEIKSLLLEIAQLRNN